MNQHQRELLQTMAIIAATFIVGFSFGYTTFSPSEDIPALRTAMESYKSNCQENRK